MSNLLYNTLYACVSGLACVFLQQTVDVFEVCNTAKETRTWATYKQDENVSGINEKNMQDMLSHYPKQF